MSGCHVQMVVLGVVSFVREKEIINGYLPKLGGDTKMVSLLLARELVTGNVHVLCSSTKMQN